MPWVCQAIADCPVRDICGMGAAAATGAVVYALFRHGVPGWSVAVCKTVGSEWGSAVIAYCTPALQGSIRRLLTPMAPDGPGKLIRQVAGQTPQPRLREPPGHGRAVQVRV